MKQNNETFESIMLSFGYKRNLHTVFADFLTMVICAFSYNPLTGQSHYEDEYMEVIGRYDKPTETDLFPKLLARLIVEMEDGLQGATKGVDVLGNFFELHISQGRKGQYFTPYPITDFMASIAGDEKCVEPMNILDPACGSGRMLLSKSNIIGKQHHYFGIDIDLQCVQMTIINLFLTGNFHSEVMCANSLSPNDFQLSYRTSFLPFGIFKITEKEKSPLWNMHHNCFPKKEIKPEIVFTPVEVKTDRGIQSSLF